MCIKCSCIPRSFAILERGPVHAVAAQHPLYDVVKMYPIYAPVRNTGEKGYELTLFAGVNVTHIVVILTALC